MNRIVALPGFLLILALCFTLMACKPEESRPTAVTTMSDGSSTSSEAEDWTPGVTFGLNGPALEVAPGISIDLDGNVGFGWF